MICVCMGYSPTLKHFIHTLNEQTSPFPAALPVKLTRAFPVFSTYINEINVHTISFEWKIQWIIHIFDLNHDTKCTRRENALHLHMNYGCNYFPGNIFMVSWFPARLSPLRRRGSTTICS